MGSSSERIRGRDSLDLRTGSGELLGLHLTSPARGQGSSRCCGQLSLLKIRNLALWGLHTQTPHPGQAEASIVLGTAGAAGSDGFPRVRCGGITLGRQQEAIDGRGLPATLPPSAPPASRLYLHSHPVAPHPPVWALRLDTVPCCPQEAAVTSFAQESGGREGEAEGQNGPFPQGEGGCEQTSTFQDPPRDCPISSFPCSSLLFSLSSRASFSSFQKISDGQSEARVAGACSWWCSLSLPHPRLLSVFHPPPTPTQ